ncbi:MAG TPA: energy-coupling factor transporter transmembrane component T [Chitinivibrionales bacterium]|nr:energy-coupling factor transporter transmembrane component T [Chitinivibrionales bacterium]
MSVFLYIKKNTFLHRLDPRTKILMLAVLFLTAALIADIVWLLALLACMAALFIAAKSLGNIARMGVLFMMIAAATFVLWALFYRISGANAYAYAAAMSIRFVDLLCAGLLYLSITSLEEVSAGLMLLGVPYPIAFALSLSFRLVIVFIDTGFTIVEAQKVRGNNAAEGSLVKRIKAYAPLLVPLILTGIKKAETLTAALESKGFSPKNKIDMRERYGMKAADWIVAVACAALAGAVTVMKVKGMI